jgi:hypothetical protein
MVDLDLLARVGSLRRVIVPVISSDTHLRLRADVGWGA